MFALLFVFILLQPFVPPPPTSTPMPLIDPCENMMPYEGALTPTTWIMPDGRDCTPVIGATEQAPLSPTVIPPRATNENMRPYTMGWLLDLVRRSRFG